MEQKPNYTFLVLVFIECIFFILYVNIWSMPVLNNMAPFSWQKSERNPIKNNYEK